MLGSLLVVRSYGVDPESSSSSSEEKSLPALVVSSSNSPVSDACKRFRVGP